MKRIIARVQKKEWNRETYSDPELLELPGEEPASKLVANMVRALKLPGETQGAPLQYWLVTANGDVIPDFESLTDAGVRNDSVLTIQSGTNKTIPDPARLGAYASLRLESGKLIELKPRSLIGRSDGADTPEVDLGNQEDGLTVSRKHASIERQGLDWYLIPFETKNPTRLKGQIAAPNVKQTLSNGDEIYFGKVKTTFKLGRS